MGYLKASSYLAAVSVLAGCASTSTQMVNNTGQVGNCGGWGFGIIGTAATLIATHDCVSKYKAAGFHEAGAPQLANNVTNIAPSNQLFSSTSTTMSSKDGLFKISLPSGWVQTTPPSPSVQLYAKNTSIDAGLVINSYNSTDILDIEAFAEAMRVEYKKNMIESTSSEPRKIKVNGFDASQVETNGTVKGGMKTGYMSTFIKTDKQIIHVVTWCVGSKFMENRAGFEKLPSGLQL